MTDEPTRLRLMKIVRAAQRGTTPPGAAVDDMLGVLMDPTESVIEHVADELNAAEQTADGRFIDGRPLLEWVWVATLKAIRIGK